MKQGALAGVKVVDLSRLLPGPYCSMVLADHGAEVVAVEGRRFAGDGLFFSSLYRNKQHVSLDLKSETGLEILYKLTDAADIVIEGFRPGVAARLGIDYPRLSSRNPRLIYCSITGYGQDGPLRDKAGHDINYLAEAGILDLIGHPDQPPTIPGVQIADILGGGMQAVSGILLALFEREKSGVGQYVDIAMVDGLLGLLLLPQFFARERGEPQVRSTTTLSHRFACYSTYETADGRYLALGAVENRFWSTLCHHLGKPEYAPLQYDEAHRELLIDWLRGVFGQRPLAAWEDELGRLDICCSPVRTMAETLESTGFRTRNATLVLDNGRTTPGILPHLTRTPGTLRTTEVSFGESTAQVLQGLGYSEEQIDGFRATGII